MTIFDLSQRIISAMLQAVIPPTPAQIAIFYVPKDTELPMAVISSATNTLPPIVSLDLVRLITVSATGLRSLQSTITTYPEQHVTSRQLHCYLSSTLWNDADGTSWVIILAASIVPYEDIDVENIRHANQDVVKAGLRAIPL